MLERDGKEKNPHLVFHHEGAKDREVQVGWASAHRSAMVGRSPTLRICVHRRSSFDWTQDGVCGFNFVSIRVDSWFPSNRSLRGVHPLDLLGAGSERGRTGSGRRRESRIENRAFLCVLVSLWQKNRGFLGEFPRPARSATDSGRLCSHAETASTGCSAL